MARTPQDKERRLVEMAGVEWMPVVSTNVARVAWVKSGSHPAARRAREAEEKGKALGSLFVEFVGGSVYHYDDVPEGTLEELLASPSVGKALNEKVKGKFAHEPISIRIPDPKEPE